MSLHIEVNQRHGGLPSISWDVFDEDEPQDWDYFDDGPISCRDIASDSDTPTTILTEPCQPLTSFEHIEGRCISMRHLFTGYLICSSIIILLTLIVWLR